MAGPSEEIRTFQTKAKEYQQSFYDLEVKTPLYRKTIPAKRDDVEEFLNGLLFDKITVDKQWILTGLALQLEELQQKYCLSNTDTTVSVIVVYYLDNRTKKNCYERILKFYTKPFSDDVIYIDKEGNLFQNWTAFIECFPLPPCLMCVPEDGAYHLEGDSVRVQFLPSSSSFTDKESKGKFKFHPGHLQLKVFIHDARKLHQKYCPENKKFEVGGAGDVMNIVKKLLTENNTIHTNTIHPFEIKKIGTCIIRIMQWKREKLAQGSYRPVFSLEAVYVVYFVHAQKMTLIDPIVKLTFQLKNVNQIDETDELFVDKTGSVYSNWKEFLDKYPVPPSLLCIPKNGTYSKDLQIEFFPSATAIAACEKFSRPKLLDLVQNKEWNTVASFALDPAAEFFKSITKRMPTLNDLILFWNYELKSGGTIGKFVISVLIQLYLATRNFLMVPLLYKAIARYDSYLIAKEVSEIIPLLCPRKADTSLSNSLPTCYPLPTVKSFCRFVLDVVEPIPLHNLKIFKKFEEFTSVPLNNLRLSLVELLGENNSPSNKMIEIGQPEPKAFDYSLRAITSGDDSLATNTNDQDDEPLHLRRLSSNATESTSGSSISVARAITMGEQSYCETGFAERLVKDLRRIVQVTGFIEASGDQTYRFTYNENDVCLKGFFREFGFTETRDESNTYVSSYETNNMVFQVILCKGRGALSTFTI